MGILLQDDALYPEYLRLMTGMALFYCGMGADVICDYRRMLAFVAGAIFTVVCISVSRQEGTSDNRNENIV
ncbi:MAG: hypothetical protein ACLRYY_04525 [Anaerobutyricum soehngenii]